MVLIAYRQALRLGRLDVAEHLLCSLETLDRTAGNQMPAGSRNALADAYLELARPRRGSTRKSA
jgi:hypothetical protein